jgi:exodeoxyribonuclease VII large subunit
VSENRQIFTLKQVVSSIRKTLEERYQQAYWVKAEMHKLNLYPSGHAFPELVQKENDKIVAQVSGSIWSHNFQRINRQFMVVVKEPLKEGTTLLLQVKVAFSETYGLSLQILDIDPNYSLGELQRERDETLHKLQAERLLNRNQQLDFPLLPQRIAIISADTSKGLSDFMKVLNNNPWNYHFFTMLFTAYLQGDMAVPSIIEQLKRIEKVKDHFDIVVIVRGGGGEVGLSCYNNYALCKEIASFPLPLLTGIGHSTNMTVAELVAFRNAITPTELADFLLQTFHDFSVPIKDAGKSLRVYSNRLLEMHSQHFSAEIKHFKNSANLYLNASKNKLVQKSQHFNAEAKTLILRKREALHFAQKESIGYTKRFFKVEKEQVLGFQLELPQKFKAILDSEKRNVLQAENMVNLMNPKNVLKRGYSITTVNGKTVHGEMAIQAGDFIQTKTYDLEIESIVQKISKHEE